MLACSSKSVVAMPQQNVTKFHGHGSTCKRTLCAMPPARSETTQILCRSAHHGPTCSHIDDLQGVTVQARRGLVGTAGDHRSQRMSDDSSVHALHAVYPGGRDPCINGPQHAPQDGRTGPVCEQTMFQHAQLLGCFGKEVGWCGLLARHAYVQRCACSHCKSALKHCN